MKITVLGNNGPFPAAGGACSGYLLQDDGTNILLDCGNGVLSNLQKYISINEIDAVIVSHLHSDHISDLMVLKYAIQIKRKRGSYDRLLEVFAPSEPAPEYGMLKAEDAFILKPVTPELVLNFGDMRITFAEMKHPVKSFAVSVECGGKRFVYSGDTSWNDNIIQFAKDSDLLLIDAGLLSRDKTGENVPHLTAKECGIVAREAGAKKLLLTHIWPEYDISELLREAKGEFEETAVANLNDTYEL